MEHTAENDRNITDEPYGRRQFIVVVEDAALQQNLQARAKQGLSPPDGTLARRAFEVATLGVAVMIPGGELVFELAKRLGKLEEQGTGVRAISQTEALKLRFPIGHPRSDVFYV